MPIEFSCAGGKGLRNDQSPTLFWDWLLSAASQAGNCTIVPGHYPWESHSPLHSVSVRKFCLMFTWNLPPATSISCSSHSHGCLLPLHVSSSNIWSQLLNPMQTFPSPGERASVSLTVSLLVILQWVFSSSPISSVPRLFWCLPHRRSPLPEPLNSPTFLYSSEKAEALHREALPLGPILLNLCFYSIVFRGISTHSL